jgi:ABC-type transporter Mla subunit MlaD
MKIVQRTDLYVGVFLIAVVATVVAALIATSGWGIKRRTLFIHTDDARDLRVDTKIYLQGLEVGRIASINPQPKKDGRGLDFMIRAEILESFSDGTELKLLEGTDAELEQQVLGGSTLLLDVHGDKRTELAPNAVIELHRRTPAMEQLGNLAGDLRAKVSNTLDATTATLNAFRHLADSLAGASGTARTFVQRIQPGTERTLSEVATTLEHMRGLLDSSNTRSGVTLQQVNATLEQSRRLLGSADSLTKLMAAMGQENRPAIRDVLENARLLSQQTIYLMEALSRRPMRVMSGVDLPDSLTSAGRASRDSAARHAPRDTTRAPVRP